MICCSSGRVRTLVSISSQGGTAQALLRRLAGDAPDARVRVLDVVHGIVGSLAGGDGEVEVERAVVAAREKGEARGVAAHFLQQLLHQDELAPALRHPDRLAIAQQGDELDEQDLQGLGLVTQRLHGRPHARHVAVVIGPDEVDEPVGGGELHRVVIGDVDAEVRQLAVRAPQHAVLVVPEERGAEPQRAVLLVRQLPLPQLLDGALGEPGVAHVALLRRPHVEADAVLARARGAARRPSDPWRSGRACVSSTSSRSPGISTGPPSSR